ncbi:MAG: hypothetical protein [Virus sp.]|nr:MAG: hypothetical protein [Virus sp.]
MASSQIVKSVSLTPHTAMIVDDVLPSGKFSAFVRECLEQYENHKKPETGSCLTPHRNDLNITRCNPVGSARKCLYCWPNGSPTAEDWKEYRRRPLVGHSGYILSPNPRYADHEWIDTKAKENNPHKIDFRDYDRKMKEQAKKKEKTPKLGLIRRFIRFIY